MNTFQLKKQNEKHERIIRDLMKLEENKKCFDCPSRIITYVNLSLNTFVCTECGGFLRELNHRIKSISLSTFTPEDIKGLQNGGNGKARQIWLAKWNDSFKEPDHNKTLIEEQREFLSNKYVNKLWFKAPINNKEVEKPKIDTNLIMQINSNLIQKPTYDNSLVQNPNMDIISIQNPYIDTMAIPKKTKHESQLFSRSFNEDDIFNKRKSFTLSRISPTKTSPPPASPIKSFTLSRLSSKKSTPINMPQQKSFTLSRISPSKISPKENEGEYFKRYSFYSRNRYRMLNDDEDKTFNMKRNISPSIDIYSNNVIIDNDQNYTNDINNYNYNIYNKNTLINNKNNHHPKNNTPTIDIYSNHAVVNGSREKPIPKDYNHSYESHHSKGTHLNKQENSSNYYRQYDENSSNSININYSLGRTYIDPSNPLKPGHNNYPVYAPRSSSLFNKSLIDSVCHTKNNYLIDNKKVYYYRKKTYPTSNHS